MGRTSEQLKVTPSEHLAIDKKKAKAALALTDSPIAYPYDTSAALKRMAKKYQKTGRAQNVSFRKLVDWIKTGERATHYLHPYPAKLLPQIAHFFLAASYLSEPGDTVLDPFGGTGTVALETMLAKRKAVFAEVNPLAQLIARVKTTRLDSGYILEAHAETELRYRNSVDNVIKLPAVTNLSYWYTPSTISQLCRIRDAIRKERHKKTRELLLVCFSAVCRKVSRADPRLSVPVRLKSFSATKDVWPIYNEQVLNNVQRMNKFHSLSQGLKNPTCLLFAGTDAQHLKKALPKSSKKKKLQSNSISLIITSPPYAGAQKYIRASSLNLGWLDLITHNGLKPLENASIGREHLPSKSYQSCPKTNVDAANQLIRKVYLKNPLRAAIVAAYLNEMEQSICEISRVLAPGGHLILVIGNNIVCGRAFKSSEYLAQLCKKHGLKLRLKLIDEIKSRGLMTKRNKTASIITREWVLVLRKPHKRKTKIE